MVEALIEMYFADVSVRLIDNITEAPWGTKVSPGTIKNPYEHIHIWRNRPLTDEEYSYVYVDGIFLKCF